MKLTLALAQINTRLGNVQANLEKHLSLIDQARASGADLILFPELSLTGYVLQDLAAAVAISPSADDPVFRPLLQASQELDLVFGFVDEDARHRFYIASAYLSRGQIMHVHHKVYLPTYGLFDEGRFFAWGDAIHALDTRFGRAGILICEDILARFATLSALAGRSRSLFIAFCFSRARLESCSTIGIGALGRTQQPRLCQPVHLAIISKFASRLTCSSVSKRTGAFLRRGIGKGAISALNFPSSIAFAAL